MMIRMLTMSQLPEALVMANHLFDKEMASVVSPECTASFHMFASEPVIRDMMQKGTLHIWGAFNEREEIVGVASMNDPYHISMICVREDSRRQGISRQLLETMAAYGVMPGDKHPLSVNALDPSVDYFRHVGFVPTGQKMYMLGVQYTPMQTGYEPAVSQYQTAPVRQYPAQRVPVRNSAEKMPGWLKILIALICVTAVAVFLYAVSMIMTKSIGLAGGQNSSGQGQTINPFAGEDPGSGEGSADGSDQEQTGEGTGIDAIPVYTAKDLKYEIRDSAFSEQDAQGKYTVSLEVHYPQLSGLEENEDKINETIKEFALETEKAIYENPDQVKTKKILELEKVYIYNNVTYNVCYQANDFVSIVFNDISLLGDSQEQGEVRVRTLNLDLKTGKVYEPAEVFKIDDDTFQKSWEESVRKEAGDKIALPEFGKSEDAAILTGKNEKFPPAFFVDKDGVEIGFSVLDSEKGGWVTGPIPKDEIIRYKTDSAFWEQVTWK